MSDPQWQLPEGCELIVEHRDTDGSGQWHTVGWGYVRCIDSELEELHGPMRPGFFDEMIGLGWHP